MRTLNQSFSVPFRFNIYFTNGLFRFDNPVFKEALEEHGVSFGKKILFVIEDAIVNANPLLLRHIKFYTQVNLPEYDICDSPMVIPGGEQVKNRTDLVDKILESINRHGVDRQSYVIAIGGGAVLDMVGYAASIAHRGIRHIRIPTTVLSQNDSGIGVKNSINAFGKKNFLGNFTPPYAVINDFDFLLTLDDRDWRSGISEAVKVALIKDADFFQFIKQNATSLANREMLPMQQLIHRCAEMHMQHIGGAGDPFEMGSSRPLDFGHWAAHKLEQLTLYSLRHGEAVAIGIGLDCAYSFLSGRISKSELFEILDLIKLLGFSLFVPEMNKGEDLISGLNEFREHLGGRLTIMLLEKIGKGIEVNQMDHELILQSLELLREYECGVLKEENVKKAI